MGFSGKKDVSAPADGAGAAQAEARKSVERERLAEALRANLRRRKAQSRAREALDLTRGDAPESGGATQDDRLDFLKTGD